MFSFRRWLLFAALAHGSQLVAQPPLTTVQDVLYTADGNRFNGVVTITWKTFEASNTSNVSASVTQVQVSNGNLFVQLAPTTNANPPAGYAVQYSGEHRAQFAETWVVPPSTTPLRVRDVRLPPGAVTSQGPPASVIVQISDVIGLQAALNLRPSMGAGFAVARAAVIDASGAMAGAIGNLTDCVHVDGTSGSCGVNGSGGTGFVDAEIPAGTMDGVNNTFTLANAPNPPSSLAIYRNGILLRQTGDFTVTGNAIVFAAGAIPQPADELLASYRISVAITGVGFVDGETPAGTVNSVNAVFAVAQTPSPAASLAVYRNGVRVRSGLDYTLTGNAITFALGSIPQTGDVLQCTYRIVQ
ncbi:MAG TPA: hypothetical protein VH157_10765 [Bryobacteraceae bacterium]|jgi:hypothetical protein|nr:hypothetical protein [Bryobacteraceae bacterium]